MNVSGTENFMTNNKVGKIQNGSEISEENHHTVIEFRKANTNRVSGATWLAKQLLFSERFFFQCATHDFRRENKESPSSGDDDDV